MAPDLAGLAIRRLAVSFGKARVLYDVNLDVSPGMIVGLAGRNGAGKTTLLRTISGLVSRSGRLSFAGEELPARPDQVARKGILHVPEGRGLIAGLTVRENLRFGCAAVGVPFTPAALHTACAAFPVIADLLERRAGLLSGGQQQMVAIARGLVVRPRLLLVDELSLGLAPKTAADTLKVLIASVRRENASLLVVDQNVRSLLEACDRMYFLDSGVAYHWVSREESGEWERFFLGDRSAPHAAAGATAAARTYPNPINRHVS